VDQTSERGRYYVLKYVTKGEGSWPFPPCSRRVQTSVRFAKFEPQEKWRFYKACARLGLHVDFDVDEQALVSVLECSLYLMSYRETASLETENIPDPGG
jgi:hypothetical protein